jgi:hypothetical protein
MKIFSKYKLQAVKDSVLNNMTSVQFHDYPCGIYGGHSDSRAGHSISTLSLFHSCSINTSGGIL